MKRKECKKKSCCQMSEKNIFHTNVSPFIWLTIESNIVFFSLNSFFRCSDAMESSFPFNENDLQTLIKFWEQIKWSKQSSVMKKWDECNWFKSNE